MLFLIALILSLSLLNYLLFSSKLHFPKFSYLISNKYYLYGLV